MSDLQQAIAWFESRAKNTPMPGAREMFKKALEALLEKAERENPEPLTQDELRQMKEATPVWWQTTWNDGFWCLTQTGVIMVPSGHCYDISECEGRVYRHKPKEAE